MLFLRGKRHICLLIPLLLLIHSCNLDGYEDNALGEVGEADIPEQPNNDKLLRIYEIDDIAIGVHGARFLENEIGRWGYESGYNWIEGEGFRENGMFDISFTKYTSEIQIDLSFDLETLQPFPIVYDYKFNDEDEADYLHIELIFRNNQNSKKFTLEDNINLSTDGSGHFNAVLELKDFKDFPTGMMEYTVEVRTTFTSFFDIRSKVKPVSAKLSFNYNVPQMYKTVFSFKSLRLNEDETSKLLGDNDFGNGTPETGIQVLYKQNSVLFGYSKNSFNYIKNRKVDIYHLTPEAFVTIRALDVDYGFNSNDLISDTTLNLKSLEGTDYFNLKMKCVDELLIFTQFKGKAN